MEHTTSELLFALEIRREAIRMLRPHIPEALPEDEYEAWERPRLKALIAEVLRLADQTASDIRSLRAAQTPE